MATARGDKMAARAAASNVATKARHHYERAKPQLDGLPAARPAVELQSFIDAASQNVRFRG